MKKKTMTCTILAATVTMLGAAGVFAQSTDRVEAQGIAFELPEEIRDLVTVRTDGLEADELVSVYETASLDAAAERGEEDTGAGWIFSISAIPEDRLDRYAVQAENLSPAALFSLILDGERVFARAGRGRRG